MNPDYTNLVSYEIENIVIVVRNHVTSEMPIKTQIICSLPLMIIIWTIFRKIFRTVFRSSNQSWASALFDSFRALIATMSPHHVPSRSEKLMHASVLLLTIITSNLVTAIVFKWLLAEPRQYGADSFKDLYEQRTPIIVSEFLYAMRNEFVPRL